MASSVLYFSNTLILINFYLYSMVLLRIFHHYSVHIYIFMNSFDPHALSLSVVFVFSLILVFYLQTGGNSCYFYYVVCNTSYKTDLHFVTL